MDEYFVYMLSNKWHTVLYTGLTNSLEGRLSQHKDRVFAGFTKTYNCDQLMYFEVYRDLDQAVAREKQIKGWTRAKKNALIETMNPEWNDLSANWSMIKAAGPSLRSGPKT